MKRYHAPVLLVLLAMLVFSIFGSNTSIVLNAYAQGVGTDRSLAATIGDKQVAVEATLSPNDIDAVKNVQPTMLIRTLDPSNNSTFTGIDYRVVVTKDSKTLLDQDFQSSDGIVFAKLIPDAAAPVAQVNGKANNSDKVQVSMGSPVEIKSRIMSEGGLYKISVTLQNSSTGLQVGGQGQTFDLYVSVSGTQDFTVQTAEGSQKISVKTFYANVSSLDYDRAANSISFSMPFDWSSSYVLQVPVVHLELEFPKALKEMQVNGYHGFANGKELPADAVLIDDYSSEDLRLVHFVINNDRLTHLPTSGSSGANGTIDFVLKTSEKPKFPLDLLSTSQKYLWQLAWGPEVIVSGEPIAFVMNIQNNQATSGTSTLVDNASFDFVISKDGHEVYRQHLTSGLGTFSNYYTFPSAGSYSVAAQKINGEENESAKIDVVVLQGNNTSASSSQSQQQPQQQPAKPSGCLIATAAFGSELTPQVQFLRGFRDDYVVKSMSGSAFMDAFNTVYYSFSPQVADYERQQPWLQATVKAAVYPLFGILMASEQAFSSSGGGEGGTILAGVVASTLIGAVYVSPLAAGGIVAARKKVSIKLVEIAAMSAAGALVATLVALAASSSPALSVTTAAFVVALAATAALAVVHLVQQKMIATKK
ncbi:MAG TPA: CFI-box-CTERM domain-containing protein [Nitrososphaera sp.]|nr:CFI-box-CTERM domain-containing protein [Nitrososphaera sp.]